MDELTRRQFVRKSAAALTAAHVATTLARPATSAAAAPPAGASPGGPTPSTPRATDGQLRWLEGPVPPQFAGTTWGVPWPRGAHHRDQSFALTSPAGEPVPLQSWPLAIWPDGSLKWSAHAIPADAKLAETFQLAPGGNPAAPPKALRLEETADAIEVDSGVVRCRVPRGGASLFASIDRDGRTIAANARLVCLREDRADAAGTTLRLEPFTSAIEKASVESSGPVRVVVRLDGKHKAGGGGGGRAWLPFTVRLYFYAGGEGVRIVHTFVFDGDADKDFIRGLGVRFDVPMKDPLYDRHIRFAGESGGLWAEGVRNLTGLRRDPGRAVIEAQLAGQACPPISPGVVKHLEFVPAWGDYTLFQSSADAFEIRKRTKEGFCWIKAASGGRAPGTGYVGGATGGGVAFGLRDFWQRHPTQLDVRGATGEKAEVTMWLWSPDAPAMDLRFYHDVMGMETHEQQLQGLDITYEDYEPGFGTATGIARTSEMMLWAVPATPPRERIVQFAQMVATPPLLAASPQQIHAAGVFGNWSLPDRSTPAKKKIEDAVDWHFDYYAKQREERRWYGFWDYGDIRHTYDRDRHEWRYDVGGFAWDNSELSPDLWLYYAYLRSGRSDIFRFAEAMTRHTGEVDVYHLGRFAKLGTRHGVVHWGDSAKQLRISTALYRRFYYYLTGDERVGDLLKEQVDADRTFATLDPIRKIRREKFVPQPHALGVSLGTDWSALAGAWFTEYERTGDGKIREKLLTSMRSIGALPHGFLTDGATYDPDTGAFTAHGSRMDVSHLAAVFGLPEICAELIQNFDVPEFERAWIQYCTIYNAGPEAQRKAVGQSFKDTSLTGAHSRLTAYAAMKTGDAGLAKRAWQEFSADDRRWAPQRYSMTTARIDGPAVLRPVDEAAWVSTNDTAQWCLSAIENLALIGDALPANEG